MASQRNISVTIPRFLLEQISNRASVNGRTRNAEVRYLVDRGLELAGEGDVAIELPRDDWTKSITRIDSDVYNLLNERSRLMQRSLGRELVRLAAFALQEVTNRNLRIIEEMIQQRGSEAPALPQPVLT